jgi:formylglycine-generating enzyme required for sulfatase activity
MAGRPEEGGKIDGFHGPAPVNDPRMDKDKSPFGVRLMFGNLSEWTSTPGGVALGQQRLRIMGNSYTSLKPSPLSHRSASPIIPSTRNALTGFRLVSDSPPQKKSD